MYLLEIEPTRNRIHLTLSERFDERQATALLQEMRQGLDELERGFLVLCDLTTLAEFDPSARQPFRDTMDLCNERGIRKVVRIIPEPLHDFGLAILSYFHYDSRIPVITCENYKEALMHLE